MAIQSAFNKIKSDSITRLTAAQVVVKATLDMSSDNSIILGTSADARALAIEPMQGEVLINGKVNFKTIFHSVENGIMSLDYYADFTDNLKDNNIVPSSKLLTKLNVLDTDSNLNGGEVILTAVVEIVVEEIRSQETEALMTVEEDVFAKYENINSQYLKVIAEGAFEIFEEIEASAEVDKILIYDAHIAVTSAKCGINTIIVSGEAYAVISYKSGDSILSRNIIIPFNEELDAEGANADNIVVPEMLIKNKRIVLSGSKGDNIIRAEMVVSVKAPVFSNVENRIISDLYSCNLNMETEEKIIDNLKIYKDWSYKEKISAVATLDAGMPPIKGILTCCLSRNNIANLIASDNEIVVEGLMTTCVLYLNEENIPTSVRAELPYSLRLPAEGVNEGDIINGYGSVYNVGAKANNANEVEVKSEIRICLNIYRTKLCKVISKLTEGEKKEIKQNAISIFIASGGEEMWDVVKYLSTSPALIEQQNPNLEMPLKAGARIKIYRGI